MGTLKDRFRRAFRVMWNEWFPKKSNQPSRGHTETGSPDPWSETEIRYYNSRGSRILPSFEMWKKLNYDRNGVTREIARRGFLVQMKEGIASSDKPMIVLMYVRPGQRNGCVFVFGFKSFEQWNMFLMNNDGQSQISVESLLNRSEFGVHFISFYQEIRPDSKNLEEWFSSNSLTILGVESELVSLGGDNV